MGEFVKLKARDGFALDAYVAKPQGEPIAGLVVVQEIYGVNKHIRTVTDEWARDGFLAVAPALFDRVEPGVDLGYDGADRDTGRSIFSKLNLEDVAKDTIAAIDYARQQTGKKTGLIGYCLGGSIAWQMASRGLPDAAVGYYGGMIPKYADVALHAPIILHFGRKDPHIPEEQIAKVSVAHPEVAIYMYDAGHGFNCDMRKDYDAQSAALARARSLEFLKKNLL